MDTLAALALATEPPKTRSLEHKPIRDGDAVMEKYMWRQIIGIALWTVIVMLFILFAGKAIWDFKYDWESTPLEEPARRTHYTIVFNTFVLMQLFNEFNCRKLHRHEYNPFERLFNNWLFIFIMIGQFALQWAFVQVLNRFAGTEPLTSEQWAACVMMASTVWIIAPLLKLTPDAFLNKIPSLVNETQNSEDDKVMQLFNKATKSNKGSVKTVQDEDGPTQDA
jgi:magnesium-transporting ATPase (P-type)